MYKPLLIRYNLFPDPNHFLWQAEARERYYGGDQAQTLYNEGVTAAFNMYGFDASTFIAPGGRYAYPLAGSLDDKIDAIHHPKMGRRCRDLMHSKAG